MANEKEKLNSLYGSCVTTNFKAQSFDYILDVLQDWAWDLKMSDREEKNINKDAIECIADIVKDYYDAISVNPSSAMKERCPYAE
jgi:hypothetical protein